MAIKKISHLDNVYNEYPNSDLTSQVPLSFLSSQNLQDTGLYSDFSNSNKSNMLRSLFEISYNNNPNSSGREEGYQGEFISKNITYAQLYRDITHNIYYGTSYLSGDKLLSGNFTINGSLHIDSTFSDETFTNDDNILKPIANHSMIKDKNITLSSTQKISLESVGADKTETDEPGIILNTDILTENATNKINLNGTEQINLVTKDFNLTSSEDTKTNANITFPNVNISSQSINTEGENLNIKNTYINLNSESNDNLNIINLQHNTIISTKIAKTLSVYVPNRALIQMAGNENIATTSLNKNVLNGASWKIPEDLNSAASLLIGSVADCDIVAKGIDLYTHATQTNSDGLGLIYQEIYPSTETVNDETIWNCRKVFETIPSTTGASHVKFENDIYGTAMQARWADLAECYSADAPYPAGTLVKFGGEEEITIADDEVNAVVSEKPAFLMDAENTENVKYKLPIALIGKVKLRILGKVKKFDRIVLSNTPGVGMVKPDKLHLDAIAIALESSEDEKEKMVLCSVKLKF